MIKHTICFSCADREHFQTFGESPVYSAKEFADKYVAKLENGEVIKCEKCGVAREYENDSYDHWYEK